MNEGLIVSTPETRWRVRTAHIGGGLVRLRRGLYVESRPSAAGTRATAAGTRATGPGTHVTAVAAAAHRLDAVVSHETAAALWGIPTLGRSTEIQVTRPRRAQGTARYEGVVVQHARLDSPHVTVRDGVPVTTPARTVVDLARRRSMRAGVVAADAALRAGLCDPEELRAVTEACRGWPGVARARTTIGFADSRSASPLESISRVAFHRYGLPAPILQALIGGDELADFLWPAYRVIGEADGLSKYTSPEVLRREKLREAGFVELGFTVFRWTWADAYHRPDALAHRAEQTLIRGGYRPRSR